VRGALRYRPRDLTQALKAVDKAGHPAKRVEIEPTGKIVIFLTDGDSSNSELNKWLESRAHQA
jgi:hypothetical protein